MKRLVVFLLCAILLSACSLTAEQVFLIPTATPTSTLTSTITPTNIPTFTPTVLTPTFTVTPTLAGQRTDTPTPDFTPTLETVTPLAMFTPNTTTPTVEMQGFVTVFTSGSEFYKAGACSPTSVKFTAQVADPAKVAYVVLFARFKSKVTGAVSPWTSITMETLGAGTFVHDLSAKEMISDGSFSKAWVQYQFVATNSKTREVGRTAIFSERLALLECKPTPTPASTATSISATPTP